MGDVLHMGHITEQDGTDILHMGTLLNRTGDITYGAHY